MRRTLYSAEITQDGETYTLVVTSKIDGTTQTVPIDKTAVDQLPGYLAMLHGLST